MLDPERTRIDKRKKLECPICGSPPADDVKPFCSKRCQDVDLHRWLGGAYRIETDETPDDMANDPRMDERENRWPPDREKF